MRRRMISSLMTGIAGTTLAATLASPVHAAPPTPPPPSGAGAAVSLKGDTSKTLPPVTVTDPSGNTTIVGATVSVAPITPTAINDLAGAEGAPTVTPDVIAASTGCSTYWVQRSAANVSHSTVWTYKETEYACYNGGRVTYIWGVAQISGKVYAWAQALGWAYIGILNKNVWDYYGNHWVYAAWTQGSFKYCPYHLGYCPQNPTPQLEMYIYGDGHADFFGW